MQSEPHEQFANDEPPVGRDLLLGLDAQQREAVTAPVGTVIVRAGAGSGKTLVLTKRIAWRVTEKSADIEHVLAITFTRQAAGELRRRLHALRIDDNADPNRPTSFTAGTFHAIAQKLLAQRYDDTNRERVKIITNRMALLTSIASPDVRGHALSEVMTAIDWAHARLVSPTDAPRALSQHGRKIPIPDARFIDIFQQYEKAKRKRGVVDFDDLMTLVLEEASRDATFVQSIRWQYRHVHVDEAQDMNPLQYQFLTLLCGDTPDLFIVGDPHQSIYGWNGSDPALFEQLPHLTSGAHVVNLPSNYRCTPQIVDAAVHVLRNAGHDADEVSLRNDGPPLQLVRCVDDAAERKLIVAATRKHFEHTGSWDSIGILARTNALADNIADVLRASGIPVRQTHFARNLRSAVEEASSMGSRHALTVWAADILDIPEDEPGDDLRTVAEHVREYLRAHPHGLVDGRSFTTWFNTIATARHDTGVEVLTFHAAKGREWPAVIIAAAEVGMLPHSSATNAASKQEEGRLAYVAFTRAAQFLTVMWTDKRGAKRTGPSPLIRHVPLGELPVSEPPTEIREARRSTSATSRVFDALNQWRHDAARASNCDVEAVLSNAELSALAARRPENESDVVAVLGPLLGTQIAPRVLRALASVDSLDG